MLLSKKEKNWLKETGINPRTASKVIKAFETQHNASINEILYVEKIFDNSEEDFILTVHADKNRVSVGYNIHVKDSKMGNVENHGPIGEYKKYLDTFIKTEAELIKIMNELNLSNIEEFTIFRDATNIDNFDYARRTDDKEEFIKFCKEELRLFDGDTHLIISNGGNSHSKYISVEMYGYTNCKL